MTDRGGRVESSRAEDVVLRFVEAINGADVDRLSALMTEHHAFVDSDGSEIAGRTAVHDAWSRYFSLMGDYRMVVEETFASGGVVVLVGTATGVFAVRGADAARARWTVPAAWRAVVDGDRIASWQVFVNPGPIVAAMGSLASSRAGLPGRKR